MKKTFLFYLILTLIIALCCFITTNNIIFTVILIIIYLLYYYFILRKKFKKYYSIIERVHVCFYFINSFVISLSVKDSLEEAFDSGARINNKNFHDQIDELTNLNTIDRMKYLRSFFNLSLYRMFLNVLDLYQDQGGNILSMSENLISESTRTEKMLNETKSIGLKHFLEFIILWAIALGILLFMKFGLSEFYQKMSSITIFPILIFGFFLLLLISVHFFFGAFTDLTIKEDNLE